MSIADYVPDDEIDDSLAANAEEPRAEIGYRETTAPRTRKPHGGVGHWVVEFRDGAAPVNDARAVAACRICGPVPPGTILHSSGTDIRRNVCGKCAGLENRRRM